MLSAREELEAALHFLAPLQPGHPAVARAIAVLDALDGDPDFEPEPEDPAPFTCFAQWRR